MNHENLIQQFGKAGLELRLLDKSFQFGRNMDLIFQMRVGRDVQGTRRHEWFEIYPGNNEKINIQILNVDPKTCQLVLLVNEPVVEFEVEEEKWFNGSGWRRINVDERREALIRQRVKFRETDKHFIITEKTDGNKRHFLMGVDERQLFVAQLDKGVSTVEEARKSLGSTIEFHEGKRKMTPRRQGEWFFIKATDAQEELIDLLLQKTRIWIVKNANIGQYAGRPQGNPHTADELVVVPSDRMMEAEARATKFARKKGRIKNGNFPIRRRDEVFVRGKVRHVDHKTVKYTHWYQVILNNEGETSTGSASGIAWID